MFTGEDCNSPCGGTGPCDFCGTVGFCCSGNTHHANPGCTTDMLAAVFATGATGFVCVSYPQERFHINVLYFSLLNLQEHVVKSFKKDSTCSDWSFNRGQVCAGNGYGSHMADKGPTECEMFCENDLKCVGFVYQYQSSVCAFVDSFTGDCTEDLGHMTGFLNRYECSNNHNCENSFIEFADINVQHGVGQRKRYCGSTKPPMFNSLGSYATITTQVFA